MIMRGSNSDLDGRRRVVVVGGGTVNYVWCHLALSAPAYGRTAIQLADMWENLEQWKNPAQRMHVERVLTRMADQNSRIETTYDLAWKMGQVVRDPLTKIVFFSAAVADFEADINGVLGSKTAPRLKTSEGEIEVTLRPADKIVRGIRAERKDIFLVAFKTTHNATPKQQYLEGLNLLKSCSANLVMANDLATGNNMIIAPEESVYFETDNRRHALEQLVAMTELRSHLTFTRSTVVDGEPVPWGSELVPSSLRQVVNYFISGGAYKPFRGATAGHFAVKLDDTTFLTSRRKTNFNEMAKVGLVKVRTDGPDTVIAYGSRPSVGGQSQRIVFADHPEHDCVVHFHCEIKTDSRVPRVSQREFECGSHECGKNTSNGLRQFGNLKAVFLEGHGPNIVFNRNIDPFEVIEFIRDNFHLDTKTGGYQLPERAE